MKAIDYSRHTPTEIAFVSTNSICQGQQVPVLWPLIFDTGHYIRFTYTSFKWANLATHNAGVIVVIVALSVKDNVKRQLFITEENGEVTEKKVGNINAYLVAGIDIIVKKERSPITELPPMNFGSKAVDGGGLILKLPLAYVLQQESNVAYNKFVRPCLGSDEYINGKPRFCLWIKDTEVDEAIQVPFIRKRFDIVQAMRNDSTKQPTNLLAKFPHRFGEIRNQDSSWVVIVPSVSSESRLYFPAGLLNQQSATV